MIRLKGLCLIACACLASVTAVQATTPADIGGLVAWYRADSVAGSLTDGKNVKTWPDATGNGHDLTDDGSGPAATYSPSQVNGHPVVLVNRIDSYSVTDPFELGPFTVFVVYAADAQKRALFRSDVDKSQGVLLRNDDGYDVYQYSGTAPGLVKRFGAPESRGRGYGITVLGRDAGLLKSFVNGADVSANEEYDATLRVGKFFHLRHTQYVKSDGDGLRIAEMLFYERYLSDGERGEVTTYLAQRYAIDLAAPVATQAAEALQQAGSSSALLAQLGNSTAVDANRSGVVLPWDVDFELDPVFAHDVHGENSKLTYVGDGARVRLHVSLPLDAATPGTNVRVLFRVNGATFLPGEGRSGVIAGGEGQRMASARAEVVTRLSRGDYVEVVTTAIGGPGEVIVLPGAAVFLAEVK